MICLDDRDERACAYALRCTDSRYQRVVHQATKKMKMKKRLKQVCKTVDLETRIGLFTAAAIFYWSMAVTFLYVTWFYTLEEFYGENDGILLRIVVLFVFVNSGVNWMLTIRTDSGYHATIDDQIKYYYERPLQRVLAATHENATVKDYLIDPSYHGDSDRQPLPWRRCAVCRMDVPPRTHHCKVCGKCVLRRDHHCYLVGCCIGHRNQRYFMVLCFYVIIGDLWGGGGILYWLYQHHDAAHMSWHTYFFPYTLYSYFWSGSIGLTTLLMTAQTYVWPLMGMNCITMLALQLHIVYRGVTMYERFKTSVRNSASWKRNFKDIFGKYWLLNFILPVGMLSGFQPDSDGVHYNSVTRMTMIFSGVECDQLQ